MSPLGCRGSVLPIEQNNLPQVFGWCHVVRSTKGEGFFIIAITAVQRQAMRRCWTIKFIARLGGSCGHVAAPHL